jgi:putative hydrolase of the HAD superfamily
MIKAVFFDLYNTLVHFYPPLAEIQQMACREAGLEVTYEGITRGYGLADHYFSKENGRYPLSKRSREEMDEFFGEYERIILQGAGIEMSAQEALRVWRLTQRVSKKMVLFEDVPSGLRALRERGFILGALSNLRPELRDQMDKAGLLALLDFVITSEDVGAQKPFPPIFLAALRRADAEPHQAVHVGDQYHSDVQGARGVGITPVLMDRRGAYENVTDCPHVRDFPELVKLFEDSVLG